MSQTKTKSLVEQLLNIGSGFIVSLIVLAHIIAPTWSLDITMSDNLNITLIFTAISVVRGYLWRRLFNWWDHHR